jgi:hypothetical protein
MSSARPLLAAALAAALAASACADVDGDGARRPGFTGGKVDDAFSSGPMLITGAFDGSKSIPMWLQTMGFARRLTRETGKPLAWTYFINTAYYSTTVKGSDIGIAASSNDAALRWAITQQAINEGHEIANHTVRHKDGSAFTVDQWRAEIGEFHSETERHLFEPVLGQDGAPLFPRWKPAAAAAAGQIGATCDADAACGSRSCAMVTPDAGFCTQACTKDSNCANGTVCGGICLPRPELPVLDEGGGVLFDSSGAPNLDNPNLVPYRIVGFRAPQLGHNAALYTVLTERGYRYDTSQVLPPGPPLRTRDQGRTFDQIFQFPLMRHPGVAAIPMDYNYLFGKISAERMQADYRSSLIHDYEALDRVPWNIGHHFSLWAEGGYWRAMQDAFRFAAAGCPQGGEQRCAEVEFVRFRDLATRLDGKNDGLVGDLFGNPGLDEDEGSEAGETCDE